jgi:hypothetical protein
MDPERPGRGRGGPGKTGPTAEAVRSLLAGLGIEVRLLRDLESGLLEQRAALARDDAVQLERVVHQIGRTLLALRETRRERTRLVEVVTGDAGSGLADVVELLTIADAGRYRAAVGELHLVARAAQRELDVNQRVIRKAIETGEQFLHQILTASAGTEPVPGYPTADTQQSAGFLLNERA